MKKQATVSKRTIFSETSQYMLLESNIMVHFYALWLISVCFKDPTSFYDIKLNFAKNKNYLLVCMTTIYRKNNI